MASTGGRPDTPAGGVQSGPGTFPYPRCSTCGRQGDCLGGDRPEEDYPECRTPLTFTSVEKVVKLFEWMGKFHGISDPRLTSMVRVVVDRFRTDREVFSEVFEPSFSWRPSGWHFYRFSYAFPGYRADPGGVRETLERLSEPFGDGVLRHVRTVLRSARDSAVTQPLFGLACDGPDRMRIKLYLQFDDGAGQKALERAGQVTGCFQIPRWFDGESLHLLGIDLGPEGIAEAKLYFLHPTVPTSEFGSTVGPVQLAQHLDGLGVAVLRNVLAIHRMKSPDDPATRRPAEVDFSLLENDLHWEDVASSPELVPACTGEPVQALRAEFGLAFRRISVPVGRTDKMNGYYVLTERGET